MQGRSERMSITNNALKVPDVCWEYWGWYETMRDHRGLYGLDSKRSECHERLCVHYKIKKEDSKQVTDNMHKMVDAVDLHNSIIKLKENQKMNNDKIRELAIALYYDENNSLGEDIDHNEFEAIYEAGYEASETESREKLDIALETIKDLSIRIARTSLYNKSTLVYQELLEMSEKCLEAVTTLEGK
jgi:hypothetical protein